MKKRTLSVIGLTIALAASMAMPVCAAEGFDAAYYAEQNPDVVATLGSDPAVLLMHYETFGKFEGRRVKGVAAGHLAFASMEEFDATYYADQNPDLVAAIGTDPVALYAHYITFGATEGRAPSAAAAKASKSGSSSAEENPYARFISSNSSSGKHSKSNKKDSDSSEESSGPSEESSDSSEESFGPSEEEKLKAEFDKSEEGQKLLSDIADAKAKVDEEEAAGRELIAKRDNKEKEVLSLKKALDTAKENEASAKEAYESAQEGDDDELKGSTSQAYDEAKKATEDAQKAYDDAYGEWESLEKDVEEADKTVENAWIAFREAEAAYDEAFKKFKEEKRN